MQILRLTRSGLVLLALLTLIIGGNAQSGPSDTVVTFLTAWGANDLPTMYTLLARQSREAFPEQVFVNRYTVANTAMGLDSLTFTIGDTHFQGITAAVTYGVTFQSSSFGEIADPNRLIRLVNEDGRWGIAWSSLDIFAEMSPTAEMQSRGTLPPRANIYDRNGAVIASPGGVITMYTSRQNMGGETNCIDLMTSVTRRPSLAFERLFASYNPDTVFYLGEINQADYEANRDALTSTCGVSITLNRDGLRTYYGNNAMAHVAGYIGQMSVEQLPTYIGLGYNEGDRIGQSGVERAFERDLAGSPERVLRIIEPATGLVLREFASTGGQDPTPVQTTIDRDLQRVTAQAMADAYSYAAPNWGGVAADGAAVVLDVNTGAILAMVSYPMFDPLLFDPDSPEPAQRVALLSQTNQDTRAPFTNHATQSRYTPGSVYKLVTAVAVLAEGIVNPGEIFSCGLRWFGRDLGDEVEYRPDWRETDEMEAAGDITPAEAIMASCNPFFWEFGAILFNREGNALAEYARALGMGAPYQILPNTPEAPAELDNPATTSLAINATVGQGSVSIPPIQMVNIVAAIANGGTVYKPYLIQQVGGFDGTEVTLRNEPTILNELNLSPEVLDEIQRGMCGATSNRDLGTAYIRFDDAPYSVCGKTGTAQTARYPNAWFVAYGPAVDPQIAIVVVVSQSLEGSQVSAPIVRRIFDYYFSARQVRPYPDWWAIGPYVPLNIPQGSTGG